VPAGTSHRYAIAVTDGTNASAKSNSVTVNVPKQAAQEKAAQDPLAGDPQ
jgi:hypothetical protein